MVHSNPFVIFSPLLIPCQFRKLFQKIMCHVKEWKKCFLQESFNEVHFTELRANTNRTQVLCETPDTDERSRPSWIATCTHSHNSEYLFDHLAATTC